MDTNTSSIPNSSGDKAATFTPQQFANAITLRGKLDAEPTFHYTDAGRAVLKGSIGMTRPQTEGSIFEPGRDWRNFVAFDADAEALVDALRAGMRVEVVGRLITDSYELGQADPATGERLYVMGDDGSLTAPRRKSSSIVITAANTKLDDDVAADDANLARVKGVAQDISYNAEKGVCNFTIVEQVTLDDGKTVTNYIHVAVWNTSKDDIAKRVGEQLKVGMTVTAVGYVTKNFYTDKQGIKHYTYRITARKVYAVRPKAEAEKPNAADNAPAVTKQTHGEKVAPTLAPAPAPAPDVAFA